MIELRKGRDVFGDTATYVGPGYNYIPLPLLGDTGMTDVIFCPWCRDLFIQVDIAGLGSPDSITIVVEGSLDNVGWDNLNATGISTTISSNGCTILNFSGALTPYVRVRIVAAAGILEDATIELKAYMQVIS